MGLFFCFFMAPAEMKTICLVLDAPFTQVRRYSAPEGKFSKMGCLVSFAAWLRGSLTKLT